MAESTPASVVPVENGAVSAVVDEQPGHKVGLFSLGF